MNEQGKPPHGIRRGLTNYGDMDFSAYLRRSFAKSMGYSAEALDRPIVGIAYTQSGFNNCHRHFPELLEAVKRGVLMAGGLPVEFPTVSLGEVFLSPTSLKYRNLMSMDTEAMIKAQPIGLGCADGRLRQNGAGATYGRRLSQPSGDPARRGANVH